MNRVTYTCDTKPLKTGSYRLLPFILLLGIGGMLPLAQAADKFTPDTDFVDNRDGTVTHKLTGLTWMRCALGQTWTGAACSGTTRTLTWDEAKTSSLTFAGKSDWRLPNPWELSSIVDFDNEYPAANRKIFPGIQGGYYWTASEDASDSSYAWIVNFDLGGADYVLRNDSNSVQLVRGGSTQDARTTPSTDFIDNGDGTVTHKRTNLTWKRCAEGQSWFSGTCRGVANTYSQDEALALRSNFAGKNDWRLPDIQELTSIVEYGEWNPAINSLLFLDTPEGFFWSSTASAYNPGTAWDLDSIFGWMSSSSTDDQDHVRLVRGTQASPTGISIAIPPSLLTINAPATTLTTNVSLTLSATATYNEVQSKLVNPIWKSLDTRVASVSSDGVVTAVSVAVDTPVIIQASYTEAGVTLTNTQSITVLAAPLLPASLLLSGSSQILSGASTTLSATAIYSNNTSKMVRPVWSSSNSALVSITNDGVLTAGKTTTDKPVNVTASFTENGSTVSASHLVTIKAEVSSANNAPLLTGLALDTGATTLQFGETVKLQPIPADANLGSCKSSDFRLILVNGDQLIAQNKAGDVRIDCQGKSLSLTVVEPSPVSVTGLARYRPQVLMAGFDPMLLDYNDSSFKVFAVVRPGAADIDSVQLKTGDASIFSQVLKFDGTLDNGDQVWTSTLKFPRGAFNQDAVLGDLFGSSNSQFQFKVLDKDQGEHSFPVLTFDNLPINPAPVASPGVKFKLDANDPPIKRAFPQVLAAGFDPQLIDLDDVQFKVVAIVRKGTADIQSVAITQNQGPFMQAMEKADTLANGDVKYSFTLAFPRGAFPKIESADLFGLQLGQFNILATDLAQKTHAFPNLRMGNYPPR